MPPDINVLLEKIQNLHDCVDRLEQSFDSFAKGIGVEIKNHGERLAMAEANLKMLNGAAWLLFSLSMGVVVIAIWKLILK